MAELKDGTLVRKKSSGDFYNVRNVVRIQGEKALASYVKLTPVNKKKGDGRKSYFKMRCRLLADYEIVDEERLVDNIDNENN